MAAPPVVLRWGVLVVVVVVVVVGTNGCCRKVGGFWSSSVRHSCTAKSGFASEVLRDTLRHETWPDTRHKTQRSSMWIQIQMVWGVGW